MPSLGQGLMAPGWPEMVSMGRESRGSPEELGGSGPNGALGPLSLGRSHPCSGMGWDQLLGAALREWPWGSWRAWRDTGHQCY